MTSTAGTDQHPDVFEISDLTDGLLSPSRAAEVRQHLVGCPDCAEVHASLEEIRGVLGTLPGPARMPDDVAERIDAALAAEALRTDPPEEPLPPEQTSDVSRETSPPPRTPAGRPRAATGPGRSTGTRRRRNAVLGAVFGTAAIGVSALLLRTVHPPGSSSADKASVSSPAAAKDFSEPLLRGQVESLLAGDPAAKSAKATHRNGAAGDENSANAPLLGQVPLIPACVEQGTGRNATVLAAEKGTYKGRQAYLLVLPHPTDSTQVQAYVIDATCVSATPPAKGKLLLTHVYPRR